MLEFFIPSEWLKEPPKGRLHLAMEKHHDDGWYYFIDEEE